MHVGRGKERNGEKEREKFRVRIGHTLDISAKNQLTEANDESMNNYSCRAQRSTLQNIQNIKYRTQKI